MCGNPAIRAVCAVLSVRGFNDLHGMNRGCRFESHPLAGTSHQATLSRGSRISRASLTSPTSQGGKHLCDLQEEQKGSTNSNGGKAPVETQTFAAKRHRPLGVYLVSISIGHQRELREWIDLIEQYYHPVLMRCFELCVDLH